MRLRKRDPVTELEKVQKKVRDYYLKHPGTKKLPARLKRQLVARTKKYAEYLKRRQTC